MNTKQKALIISICSGLFITIFIISIICLKYKKNTSDIFYDKNLDYTISSEFNKSFEDSKYISYYHNTDDSYCSLEIEILDNKFYINSKNYLEELTSSKENITLEQINNYNFNKVSIIESNTMDIYSIDYNNKIYSFKFKFGNVYDKYCITEFNNTLNSITFKS